MNIKIHLMHDWSEWSDPIETLDEQGLQQWRVCMGCNKAQARLLMFNHFVQYERVLFAITEAKQKGEIK